MSGYSILAETTPEELSKRLPPRIGSFQKVGSAAPTQSIAKDAIYRLALAKHISNDEPMATGFVKTDAEYISQNGAKYLVEFVQASTDANAYSLLTMVANLMRQTGATIEIGGNVGTASILSSDQIAFFKGRTVIRISAEAGETAPGQVVELADGLAEQIDTGDGDIPALVRHLPDWQNGQKRSLFLSSFKSLEIFPRGGTVLSAISSEGNADAVLTSYDSGSVLIVEFNTPQLATENDQRIINKIQDLWKQGQPAPSAYRRVGNYSVFVFDAPDELTAKQLIDQVKYEQVVQWLGENPYVFKAAEKQYVETTLGVLIAVVKASGVALVTCLGVGGLFGGLLFSWRRAQQKNVEAFSDAGGMLRLNLDEITPQTDAARLIRERN
jgi:Family of unknown function (DUF6599)